MPKILIVDDEPAVVQLVHRVLEKSGEYDFSEASSCRQAKRSLASESPDVAILDVVLPDGSGLDLIHYIRKSDPKLPVIFITAGGTAGTAIEAMKAGAFDYLLKPLNAAQLRDLVSRAVDARRLMSEPIALTHTANEVVPSGDSLVGRCVAMQEVYKAIGRVAPKNVTVLIRGESGTGKELIARAIYQHSDRNEAPFLAVNCAAIPESLLESELFGHEKGAFTGADRRRIGKFEQCNGGTLFLDEIGDMPLALQSKMLRLLQDQRFERVGGNETIQTNVRIITATHRDLERMSEEGHFRADLYYRLNVYEIEIPPLRERMDDMPVLVAHFLARANGELEKQIKSVAGETLEVLRSYDWPGNVRELQSVIKKAVLNASGPVLLPDFMPKSVMASLPTESPASRPSGLEAASRNVNIWDEVLDEQLDQGTTTLYDDTLQRMERWLLTRVLRHTSGNQVQAAQILGITRTTLRSKLAKLGITVGKVVDPHEPSTP